MIKEVVAYLSEEHRWNKLISLKDEINTIFESETDKKYYYSKILWLLNKSNFTPQRLFSVIHIKQRDFKKLLSNLNK